MTVGFLMSTNNNSMPDEINDGSFIFKPSSDGKLKFVGDFEGLYKASEDPWQQLGFDSDSHAYYWYSRHNILNVLSKYHQQESVAEIGCGLGQVCELLQGTQLYEKVTGFDISETAIEKAQAEYPDLTFKVGNICDKKMAESSGKGEFSIILFNQILWYILDDFSTAIKNAYELLSPGGYFLIVQAFSQDEQQYGKDIVNGFDGLIRYLAQDTSSLFEFKEAKLYQDLSFKFDDGYVLLQKT